MFLPKSLWRDKPELKLTLMLRDGQSAMFMLDGFPPLPFSRMIHRFNDKDRLRDGFIWVSDEAIKNGISLNEITGESTHDNQEKESDQKNETEVEEEYGHGQPVKSWIIRDKSTGEAVTETWEKSVAMSINTEKYEAVSAQQHLVELNRQIKAESESQSESDNQEDSQANEIDQSEQTVDIKAEDKDNKPG